MNMIAALKTVPTHAPWSKLSPMFPLRSARPSESSRPASVTIPAPRITPRIPRMGLSDKSAGGAAGFPIDSSLVFRSHGHHCRESRPQMPGQRGVVERSLRGNPLDHFREIPRCVVRRQERELRSTRRRNLENPSGEDLTRKDVYANLRDVADLDVGQLRLPIIGLHPDGAV